MKLDEHVLKPLFIHRYERSVARSQVHFQKLVMEEGKQLEDVFANIERKNEDFAGGQMKARKTSIGEMRDVMAKISTGIVDASKSQNAEEV